MLIIDNRLKNIYSGPDDYIFVNFVDHGATGILGFPNDQLLYEQDLIEVLKEMAIARKFKEVRRTSKTSIWCSLYF